ncbi:MAG: bacteriohemerythrin [Pseudomonadota bacterium]
MGRNTKMLLLVLFAGALLVAVILTFIALGAAHPVPWLLGALLIAIPVLMRWSENRRFAVWKDEYSVGVDSLDNDHKKLLTLINHLQTAVHYQTGEEFEKEALDEVVAYTRYHFEREEKMMQEAGYANLEAHKEIHREMIAKVDEFTRDYEKRGHEALEDVALYLKNWLIDHINGTDQEYSAILKQKGVGQA